MAAADRVRALYLELADWYEHRGQAQMRDRFLVLAADAALAARRPEEAEGLRLRLLRQNPHHLLKPYASLAEALKAPDVQSYVADLRRSYGPEAAQQLLESLHSSAESAGSPPPAPRPDHAAPPPEPAPPTQEVLKFFRVREEMEAELPPAIAQRQLPAAHSLPKPAGPASPPARSRATEPPSTLRKPVSKSTRAPAASPLVPESFSPIFPERPSDKDEQDLAAGFWVSSSLFLLTLLAGLALAIYTLARPFLPAEWIH